MHCKKELIGPTTLLSKIRYCYFNGCHSTFFCKKNLYKDMYKLQFNVSYYVLQISKNIFCKLKKLFQENFYGNLVTNQVDSYP